MFVLVAIAAVEIAASFVFKCCTFAQLFMASEAARSEMTSRDDMTGNHD